MNTGYKLWKNSLKVIPGGNGLLSKRPERYAGHKWPTYFDYATFNGTTSYIYGFESNIDLTEWKIAQPRGIINND